MREIQTIIIMKLHFIPSRMAVTKKTESVDKDAEKLEPLQTAGGNIKWCSHFVKVKYKVKYKLTIQCNNFTSRNLPMVKENMFTQRFV